MPAIDEPDPPGMERCFFGHPFCAIHEATMPGLDRKPRYGLCYVGHPAAATWVIPRTGKRTCRDHLRPDYLRLYFSGPS